MDYLKIYFIQSIILTHKFVSYKWHPGFPGSPLYGIVGVIRDKLKLFLHVMLNQAQSPVHKSGLDNSTLLYVNNELALKLH